MQEEEQRRGRAPRRHLRGGRLAALALCLVWGAVTASGCALTTMTLAPPPHAKVTTAMKVGQGREILLIHPFVDQRSSPERCGMKKNGYNMDTASILCVVPPEHWLAALLAEELRAAGFLVTDNPRRASPHALRIDASLFQFFLEQKNSVFTVTPEADIELNVVASNRAGFEAKRNFYFKGEDVSLLGTEDSFQLAAEDAVRQMLATVVSAVYELVQRYPELGLPPPGAAPSVAATAQGAP